ncbi:Abi-alpha family protein [Mesorhizobium amorphae]|uniref:DUF4393 domain-containing protein n=1 Tax=Mesorhizobium amorphae CCNWGS0123 TaxID=1082933 RepID=G6YCE3_9HYPH|nr:Abi-alpha family protein [Mesorhizobium amorphae]ANT53533.1 hypothetical protein A6B35_28485 [Mesorhizobium amorphae CCNWGS0123]EHH10622.1 hypothetical protein MEA186_18123 [Mesorhizobium amorphae CCNWGS0123]GLR41464.1 hypothetical protein GCM10007880_19800 [Mesorhizobium amorphae]
MGTDLTPAPEVTILKSEMEAAAARVAERAMNTTIDGVSGVVGDLFGGLFGDGLKQWRTRRLIDTLIKTKDHLEAAGIPIENAKSLPMGELYAIFEGCSKQEDISLTEMWSALLANAMNPTNDKYIDPSFSRILGNLSGLDAAILKYINDYTRKNDDLAATQREILNKAQTDRQSKSDKSFHQMIDENDKSFSEWAANELQSRFNAFSEENISYSISNLLRMGLIYPPEYTIPENLIQVGIQKKPRNENELVADDRRLRAYLRAMNDQAGAAIEKKSTLQSLVTIVRPNWPMIQRNSTIQPAYSLSGLAIRFLLACSP